MHGRRAVGVWDLWEVLETALALVSPHSLVLGRKGPDSPQESFE